MHLHLPLTFIGTLLTAGAAAGDTDPTPSNELTEVYFDFDSSTIRDDAALTLVNAAERLRNSGDSKIFLGGFADPRGSAQYNVGLSLRRAEAVRDYLTALGVPDDRIVRATYGEDGARRESFALERRVTIGLTDEPLYQLVDETLAQATAIVWSQPVTAAELDGPRPIPVATRE